MFIYLLYQHMKLAGPFYVPRGGVVGNSGGSGSQSSAQTVGIHGIILIVG